MNKMKSDVVLGATGTIDQVIVKSGVKVIAAGGSGLDLGGLYKVTK